MTSYFRMLEELFEKALILKSKLDELNRGRGISGFEETLKRVKNLWVNYKPKPRRSKILAIDSGWNHKLYSGFYVYAMKAAAVDETLKIYYSIAEVDMLSEDPYNAGLTPDLFLKYQAEIYEHDIAYKASEIADLVLVDGSLIARLMDINKRSSPRLQTEYMAFVKPLKDSEKLAFVSKYSYDKSLFDGVIGDIYYINHATKEIGYTAPLITERNGLKFSVFYVRLSEHSSALHVEVPAVIDEEYIRYFIDVLHETAIAGYPFSLRIAHKVASLPDQLMDSICKVAGLTGWIEAREVLTA